MYTVHRCISYEVAHPVGTPKTIILMMGNPYANRDREFSDTPCGSEPNMGWSYAPETLNPKTLNPKALNPKPSKTLNPKTLQLPDPKGGWVRVENLGARETWQIGGFCGLGFGV